jgi:hypothetical protein
MLLQPAVLWGNIIADTLFFLSTHVSNKKHVREIRKVSKVSKVGKVGKITAGVYIRNRFCGRQNGVGYGVDFPSQRRFAHPYPEHKQQG